ncbi:MAG: hypothetical protein P1U89_21175 [Verrucomicrobiales bacterium]|nr:hypothetical protein [Verrucomicrobiales bacterium]
MIENNKLSKLQKDLKNKKREAKPLLPKNTGKETPPSGNEVLDQLKKQLDEQAAKKEEAKAAAAELKNFEETAEKPETMATEARSGLARSAPVARSGLFSATKADYPSILEKGGSLAMDLEQGQAETPISNFFNSLPSIDAARWPNTSILPLSTTARKSALAWIGQVPDKLFSTTADLLELSFQEKGFSLRSDQSGERFKADNLIEFAKIIKSRDTGAGECLQMDLPTSSEFASTRFCCVGEAKVILNRPAILSRMAGRTNLLIVAGTSTDTLDSDIQSAIEELSIPVKTILPVIFSADSTTENWSSQIKAAAGCQVLPAVVVEPGKLRPKISTTLSTEKKKELSRADLNQRIQSGIDLISERQIKREREIRKRQKDAKRLQSQIDEEIKGTQDASRGLLGDLRQRLDEQVTGILDWTKQRNKRQFSPTGEYTGFAEQISNQLTESHLEKVASVASRRYGLPRCVVDVIEDEVVDQLHTNVKDTVAEIHRRLRNYTDSVEKELTEFHQQPVTIDTPELNEREIWSEIRQYCQIDPKIGIDLPKRDALRMFMSGSRQFIMPVSMILGGPLAKMLLPMFGADRSALNSNPIFTGSLVGLMVVGLVLFFRGAKALDREKMEQSVEKMRETVRARILREMERVEREKMELIQSTVSRMKEEWQGNLKTWVDEAITVSQNRLGRESSKVRSAGVILQKRVREVDQTRKEVEKLGETFEVVKA